MGQLEVIVIDLCVPDLERTGYILHREHPVRPPGGDGKDAGPRGTGKSTVNVITRDSSQSSALSCVTWLTRSARLSKHFLAAIG